MKEQADLHFKNAVKILNDEIGMFNKTAYSFYAQAFLACMYAAAGDKEKAIQCLSHVKERETIHLYLVNSMKEWPMLESIRHEPEFEAILAEMESKYERVHKRVGELLKEEGLIK